MRRHRSAVSGEIVEVRSIEDASKALAGAPPDRTPVAVGGDGTVGMVAAALLRGGPTGVGIGICALGTANLLAQALGLDDPRRCFATLERSRAAPIDVMRTSHPLSPVALVSISAGFEGRFLQGFEHRRRSRGRLLAALGSLPTAWRSDARVVLELDGVPVTNPADPTFSAGLYNTGRYVGGLVMSPASDLADGVAEGVVYRTRAAYLRAIGDGLRGGRPREDGITVRRTWTEARLESSGPFQIDGEIHAPGSLAIRLERRALSILVPAA
jgi:diacylglycerol kinase family enzyme